MAVYELLPSTHPSLSVPLTEVTDDQEGREQIQQDLFHISNLSISLSYFESFLS